LKRKDAVDIYSSNAKIPDICLFGRINFLCWCLIFSA